MTACIHAAVKMWHGSGKNGTPSFKKEKILVPKARA